MSDTGAPMRIQINDKITDITELKVAELKTELKKRGLPITGNKSELHDKLRKFLIAQPEVNDKQQSPNKAMSMQQQQSQQLLLQQQQQLLLQQQQQQMLFEQQQQQLAALAHQQAALEAQRLLDEQQKQEKERQIQQQQEHAATQARAAAEAAKKAAEAAAIAEHEKEQQLQAQLLLEKQNLSLNDSNCSNTAAVSSSQASSTTIDQNESVTSSSQPKLTTNTNNLVVENLKVDLVVVAEPVVPVAVLVVTAGDSRGNSTERSESCIKEVPMSGDRNRFSRSRSPKPRWQGSDQVLAAENGEAKEIIESVEITTTKVAPVEEVLLETATTPAVPKARKRKWLSTEASSTKKASLTISTDTLKNYLPNVPAPSPNKETSHQDGLVKENENDNKIENDSEETSNDEPKRKFIENSNPSSDLDNVKAVGSNSTNGYHANDLKQQNSRTVILEETNELIYEDALNSTKPTNLDSKPSDPQPTSPQTISATTPTPTTTTGSILHISNLTRPFTVSQLKELLSKYGPLLSNTQSQSNEKHFFWINSVKSHCYVAFVNEPDAKSAREALNNTQWPQSNPKQLKVDFTTLDELILHMNSDNPVHASSKSASKRKSEPEAKNASTGITLTVKNENSVNSNGDASGHASAKQNGKYNGEKENKDRDRNKVREWDLPKIGTSRNRSRSPQAEGGGGRQRSGGDGKTQKEAKSKKDETPHKTLDDIFRKTLTTPFIYWLPLTEEQSVERRDAETKRNEERIRRAEERQMADYESKVATEKAAQALEVEARIKNEVNAADKGAKKVEKNAQDSSFETSKDDLEKSIDTLVSKPEPSSKKETSRDRTATTTKDDTSTAPRDRDRDRDRDRNYNRDADRYANNSSSRYRGGGSGNYSSYNNSRREPSPTDRRGPPPSRDAYHRQQRPRSPIPSSSSRGASGYNDNRRSNNNSSRGNNDSRDSRNKRRSSSRSRSKSSDSSSSSSSNSSRSSRSSRSSSSSSSSSRSRTRSPAKTAATTTTTSASKHARSSSENSDKRKRVKTNGTSSSSSKQRAASPNRNRR